MLRLIFCLMQNDGSFLTVFILMGRPVFAFQILAGENRIFDRFFSA